VPEARRDVDVEVSYSTAQSVAKLRRLADALEQGTPFRIQVAGERFQVPARARFSVEHERDGDHEEVELQLTWSLADVGPEPEGPVV
jgi:amphi-Trp domain-containing protein